MPRERDERAGADLAILVSVCALVAVASIHFEVADRIIDADGRWEPLNLNGILAVAVAGARWPPRSTPSAATGTPWRIRAELARLSLRDDLTGLPNRLFLSEWLDSQMRTTRREGTALALLFVDLDRFKMVNDTHGHDVGDAVLVALATRLRACIADYPGGRAVRYAGDEFLVICREDPLRPTADRLARAHPGLARGPVPDRRRTPSGSRPASGVAVSGRPGLRRGPHPSGRRRHVRRQGPRRRPPGDLRRERPRRALQPGDARAAPAPGRRGGRVPARVPAGGRGGDRARWWRSRPCCGGTTPNAGPVSARRVHPRPRGVRPHRPGRRLDHGGGHRPGHAPGSGPTPTGPRSGSR